MSPEPREGFDEYELPPWEKDESEGGLILVPASSIPMEQTKWAWTERIPLGGVTILAGQEGSGKSTILTDVLAKASRGQLEGDLKGESVASVYATAEDSLSRTLKPRLAAAGADLGQTFFVQVDGLDGGLSIPGDLLRLTEEMKRRGARLLVLDPLGAHLGASLDTHRDASVRRALAPLAGYMEQLDAACVGIMHWSKAPTTVALDRVNGSRAFTAAARAMLAVGDDPNDATSRVLILAKSNLGCLDVPALRFRIEGRTVVTEGGDEIATSGVTWLGMAPGIGVDDIFATRESPGERSERDELCSVIDDVLASGGNDMATVRGAVRDAGLDASTKAIQRALTRMGVNRKPSGFGGKWILQRAQPGHSDLESADAVHTVHTVHNGEDPAFSASGLNQSGRSGRSGQSGAVKQEESTVDDQPPFDETVFLDDESPWD